jgi:type IV secretory pathway TraG/TraD family ATPase VirD4
MSGISNAVDVFNHPGVAAITTGDSEQFTVADIFSTPRLLVIGAPLHGGSMAGTVSSLLAGQIVRHLYTRYTSAEGTDAFLCFDEAPRLSKNIDLEQLLTTTRRTRTSVVLGVQNVSQLEDRTRSTILNNCSTFLSLPTPDQASAEFFASRLGHRQQSTFTSNQSYGGEGGHRQITRQLSTVNVIGLREIMHPPWGDRIAMAHITQLGPSPLLLDLTRRDLVS